MEINKTCHSVVATESFAGTESSPIWQIQNYHWVAAATTPCVSEKRAPVKRDGTVYHATLLSASFRFTLSASFWFTLDWKPDWKESRKDLSNNYINCHLQFQVQFPVLFNVFTDGIRRSKVGNVHDGIEKNRERVRQTTTSIAICNLR